MSDFISQGLKVAGNTGLSLADGLDALNNFLQAEYRRKYPWQRKTVTLNLASGAAADATDWDATFLDLYQQQDGSCGRFVIPGSALPGYIAKTTGLAYRNYIAKADRLSATGPPQYIVADPMGATWYVYPVPDRSYTVTVDVYYLPAKSALGDVPLWSSWAPEDILVQVVKVWALEWMQDDRFTLEKRLLFGDAKADIPGMLPTYRRRALAQEGVPFQTALDQRIFLPMGMTTDDRVGSIWD